MLEMETTPCSIAFAIAIEHIAIPITPRRSCVSAQYTPSRINLHKLQSSKHPQIPCCHSISFLDMFFEFFLIHKMRFNGG